MALEYSFDMNNKSLINLKTPVLFSLMLSFLTISASPLVAAAEGMRKCEFTGMSARSGDAKALVLCEGYDLEHYLADDEKVTNLEIILYVGKPAVNRKYQAGYAQIKTPRATFRDYNLAFFQFDELLLKGLPVQAEGSAATAVQDIQVALKKRKTGIRVGAEDNLAIGLFEIPESSKLYNSSDKASGEASKTTIIPTQHQELQDTRRAQQEQMRVLSETYGVSVTVSNHHDWLVVDAIAKKRWVASSCEIGEKSSVVFSDGAMTNFVYEQAAQQAALKYAGLTQDSCKPLK